MSVEHIGKGYVKICVSEEELENSIAGLSQLKPILQTQVMKGNGRNTKQGLIDAAELPQAERNRRYAGRNDRRGKDQKIAGYGAAAYLQPLAALIAGGNWNNGANCGARAVNCNNYPWNVNTNIGARGACDLVRTLQAQSSTEYWQGLRKG